MKSCFYHHVVKAVLAKKSEGLDSAEICKELCVGADDVQDMTWNDFVRALAKKSVWELKKELPQYNQYKLEYGHVPA